MDQQYLMGQRDGIQRSFSRTLQPTALSPALRHRLLTGAITGAIAFYQAFFERSSALPDAQELATVYEQELLYWRSLGLFETGGIRELDHLNLWCLARVFEPETYLESGVFIGSSLSAWMKCPTLKKVVAIDPNLQKLRVPKAEIPGVVLVEDQDFSQLEDRSLGETRTLAYFDDHINTAQRIVQAAQKGIRYLLFDDSPGWAGVVNKPHPAVPTVPMIMHYELLQPGDEATWGVSRIQSFGNIVRRFARNQVLRSIGQNSIQLSLRITPEMLAQCQAAKQWVKKYDRIPDLGDYLPQPSTEVQGGSSKYLIELHSSLE